eukprot:767330-Hanusia_phi.AAC.9
MDSLYFTSLLLLLLLLPLPLRLATCSCSSFLHLACRLYPLRPSSFHHGHFRVFRPVGCGRKGGGGRNLWVSGGDWGSEECGNEGVGVENGWVEVLVKAHARNEVRQEQQRRWGSEGEEKKQSGGGEIMVHVVIETGSSSSTGGGGDREMRKREVTGSDTETAGVSSNR